MPDIPKMDFTITSFHFKQANISVRQTYIKKLKQDQMFVENVTTEFEWEKKPHAYVEIQSLLFWNSSPLSYKIVETFYSSFISCYNVEMRKEKTIFQPVIFKIARSYFSVSLLCLLYSFPSVHSPCYSRPDISETVSSKNCSWQSTQTIVGKPSMPQFLGWG